MDVDIASTGYEDAIRTSIGVLHFCPNAGVGIRVGYGGYFCWTFQIRGSRAVDAGYFEAYGLACCILSVQNLSDIQFA